jgi:signal transduction histidine kinase
MAAIRRPVRSRPIRLFLISMFAVPLISLVGLWAFAATITISNAVNDHYYNVGVTIITKGFSGLTAGLPEERAASYIWLTSDRKTSDASLLAARKLVDQGITASRAALAPAQGRISPQSRAYLDAMYRDLGQLGRIRAQIDNGTMSPLAAFQAFTKMIDDQWGFYFAGTKNNNSPFADISVGATDMSYAVEMGAREAVLVGGALLDRGQMSAAARQQFAASVANRRSLTSMGIPVMTTDLDAPYLPLINSPQYQAFQNLEDQIIATPAGKPIQVNPAAWQADSGAYLAGSEKAIVASGVLLSQMSGSLTTRLVTEAVLAGGVGLAAVVASIFLLVWFGRKVRGDLGRLDENVRSMAEERLPRVVERLRRGEDVDVAAESPPPEGSSIREISQIAESFATVQGAAVAAAVEQARLRKGVNQVFLNISMRNQSLLHRQLGMLDSMERRTSDPGALADLFRLDHLTTRMRRHAEGLIILSGSTPGRGWREPVPVVDVLRAAVAEVEDYVRVDVLSESRDLVAGNAVNDVIHLVAELVENATVFSPPNTRIEVRADRAGTGLVAEIEDRGLGLSEEELADINRRLANPPEFDLANSEQLGLFVVSRLAARHAIKVALRQSIYGGTTAILVLPFGVIVREEEAGSAASHSDWPADGQPAREALPPGGSGSGPSATGPLPPFGPTGRHRLAAAATGRRADIDPAVPADQDEALPPRPLPRPPWDYAQPEPQGPELPPSPSAEKPPWETETAVSWPDAFSRSEASQEQARPAEEDPLVSAPGGPHGQQPAGPVSSGSHLGMPIRIPQASLAPQLRGSRETGQRTTGSAAADIDERSPEATRNMMIMMQQGWERGRVDDLDDPAGAPGDGTDR